MRQLCATTAPSIVAAIGRQEPQTYCTILKRRLTELCSHRLVNTSLSRPCHRLDYLAPALHDSFELLKVIVVDESGVTEVNESEVDVLVRFGLYDELLRLDAAMNYVFGMYVLNALEEFPGKNFELIFLERSEISFPSQEHEVVDIGTETDEV